ncbi:MAG: hypothetical protein JNK12_04015 [Acidimicrobiales bacterium]|nr:hypothetical protein [Acidimicrobiales bacterium]
MANDPGTDLAPAPHHAPAPALDLRDVEDLPTLDELHDRWGSASRSCLGLSRQQWHHPATSRLVDAIAADHDLTEPLRDLGAARAEAGLSLDELLGDLDVLGRLLPRRDTVSDIGIDRVDHLRAAAVASTAWAETFYASAAAPRCVDALTGLATVELLEARLDQLSRQRRHDPRRPRRALVVLALRCEHTSPFATLSRRIRAADQMRSAFPTSDTVALLEPTHALVALVEEGPGLDEGIEALTAGAPHDRVWVEPLPSRASDAVALVRELATIPRLPTVAPAEPVRHP